MAKKRGAKGGKGRGGAARDAGRTNTIKSNGGLPASQAVAPAADEPVSASDAGPQVAEF